MHGCTYTYNNNSNSKSGDHQHYQDGSSSRPSQPGAYPIQQQTSSSVEVPQNLTTIDQALHTKGILFDDDHDRTNSCYSGDQRKRAILYVGDRSTTTTQFIPQPMLSRELNVAERRSQQQQVSVIRPGAIAVDGPDHHDDLEEQELERNDDDDDRSEDFNTLLSTTDQATETAVDSTTGLVVANLVDSTAQLDLPMALEEDTAAATGTTGRSIRRRRTGEHESSSSSNNNNNKIKTGMGATCILLIIVPFAATVIIMIVLLQPRQQQMLSKTTKGDPSQLDGSPPSNSATPRSSFEEYVLSLFPEGTKIAIQQDSDSPQSKAFQWLIEGEEDLDTAEVLAHMQMNSSSSTINSSSEDRIKQKMALATLHFATGGEKDWQTKTNWLNKSVDECNWYNKPTFAMKDFMVRLYKGYAAEMNFPTSPPTTTPTTESEEEDLLFATPRCNEDGLYQHLWLDENNLVGHIPAELYWLTSLQTLSIAKNKIHGTISTHVGQLTSLRGLAIFFQETNGGTIPTEVGLLSHMRFLKLVRNDFHGSVPSELWSLTTLESLFLGLNPNLHTTIPARIGHLSRLRWLILRGAHLSGTIPTQIGMAESLEWISLVPGGGGLSATLPIELGKLTKLTHAFFQDNQLTGPVPTELGSLTLLNSLNLANNQFTGTIPVEFGLLNNLTLSLNLGRNQITGTIPSQLGLLALLEELSINNNMITGTIPPELGDLKVLGQLSLEDNNLSGTIPLELSFVQQSLYTLSLEGNPWLSGTLPLALCNINGTCIGQPIDDCPGKYGLSFACTSLVCGCGCPCGADNNVAMNGTSLVP